MSKTETTITRHDGTTARYETTHHYATRTTDPTTGITTAPIFQYGETGNPAPYSHGWVRVGFVQSRIKPGTKGTKQFRGGYEGGRFGDDGITVGLWVKSQREAVLQLDALLRDRDRDAARRESIAADLEQLRATEQPEPTAPACECAAELLGQGYHTAGCPLVVELHAAMDDSAPARDALDAAQDAVEAAEEGTPEHAAAWDAHGDALAHLKAVNDRLGVAVEVAIEAELERVLTTCQHCHVSGKLVQLYPADDGAMACGPCKNEHARADVTAAATVTQLPDVRRRKAARRLAKQLQGAQDLVHELLDDRARLAYRSSVAGLSHSLIAADFGVSRQMAAKLITRGYELVAREHPQGPIDVPPAN